MKVVEIGILKPGPPIKVYCRMEVYDKEIVLPVMDVDAIRNNAINAEVRCLSSGLKLPIDVELLLKTYSKQEESED